jgi:hypothetical protein
MLLAGAGYRGAGTMGNRHAAHGRHAMDEDRFNMEPRKFLKQVSVRSQRVIERVARDQAGAGRVLRPRIALTSPDAPGLDHVVEAAIPLD